MGVESILMPIQLDLTSQGNEALYQLVTYDSLKKWLTNEGWHLQSDYLEQAIFTHDSEDNLSMGYVTIWVPKLSHYTDYHTMIERVLTKLVFVHGRKKLEILFELGVITKQDIRDALKGLI